MTAGHRLWKPTPPCHLVLRAYCDRYPVQTTTTVAPVRTTTTVGANYFDLKSFDIEIAADSDLAAWKRRRRRGRRKARYMMPRQVNPHEKVRRRSER